MTRINQNQTQQELLARIEKLEQAVEDIRTSCPCLFMNQEPEQECSGSFCFECEQLDCICDDFPEKEPEDIDIDQDPENKETEAHE